MTKPRLPRLLLIGDAVAPTGFARVIYGIFRPLAERYQIHQLGFNYDGDPHDWPWPIYPAGGADRLQWGVARIDALVREIQPDLVFLLHDPWVLAPALAQLRAFPGLPVVVYASFNAGPLDPETLAPFSGCARFVVYTEFARRAVAEGLARAADAAETPAGEALRFPEIEVLPHGVDTGVFHPVEPDRDRARRLARERLFPQNPELTDAFVVLNANRNQTRKRIDVTVEGFARFAAGKPPNVHLHLHMGLDDQGWDLQRLARRLGIDDRLILTNPSRGIPSVSDAELNLIFNAADVGINTATSEGWGLVSFEQAAAGLAQVVPGHTSGLELWSGAAELLEPSLTLWEPTLLCAQHFIDSATVAAALERLYRDDDHRRRLEAAALARARDDRYRWSEISARWDRLFEETLAGREGDHR
ncbi:MAG TPA: glycosyltransferase [Thermoanaerobaculia bacterium]|jgi:glycosyltransferase involved in cell wall biosynthesis|nr:glycosyltransferase [Thermoanaerobaculia bacterium]